MTTVGLHSTFVRFVVAIAITSLGCTGNDDIHAPSIASVNPHRAVAGTSILVSGSYFCQQVEASSPDDIDPLACEHVGTVQFGSTPVVPNDYGDTAIVVLVPNIALGSVQLRVSVGARTSNAVSFTVE